jgi:hypothetical protein
VVLFGRKERVSQKNKATADEAIEVLDISKHQTKKIHHALGTFSQNRTNNKWPLRIDSGGHNFEL